MKFSNPVTDKIRKHNISSLSEEFNKDLGIKTWSLLVDELYNPLALRLREQLYSRIYQQLYIHSIRQ